MTPSPLAFAEALWCSDSDPFGSHSISAASAALSTLLPCCHIWSLPVCSFPSGGGTPFKHRFWPLPGVAEQLPRLQQDYRSVQMSRCARKGTTWAFCFLGYIALHRRAPKIQWVNWGWLSLKGQSSHFFSTFVWWTYLISHEYFTVFPFPRFHELGKCNDPISKIMIQGKGAPSQRWRLPLLK